MDSLVARQVAGVRKGLAAGRADVGAVSIVGSLVSRQVAGLREGLTAGRALKDELGLRPISPPVARTSDAFTSTTNVGLFSAPLASDSRSISHLTCGWRYWSNLGFCLSYKNNCGLFTHQF
jgi:hypothetical protein